MKALLLFLLALSAASIALAQSNIRTYADRDAFTDADRSRVVVSANEPSFFGRTNALVWRCNGPNDFELFVVNDEFLGGDRVPVIYRFGSDTSMTERWAESTSGTAAFASATQARRFTDAALVAERVAIGLTDYRGRRYEYTFNLTGLKQALENLGCVRVTPLLADIRTALTIPEAYRRLKDAVAGETFTEGLNVMYFDDLTVRFVDVAGRAYLEVEGTNAQLYERIRGAVR